MSSREALSTVDTVMSQFFFFLRIFWVCIVYEFVILYVCMSNAYIITMGNQLNEH